MKTALTLLAVALLVSVAGATTVDFDSYTPLDACSSSISTGGLDFNGTVSCNGSYLYVWDGGSPNGNGTPALIFAGFGSGATMTMSLTGGGVFNLASVDMVISWYDPNTAETILVNGNPLNLTTTLTTFNLNLNGVSSVVFSDLPSGAGYWLMDNVVYNNTPEPGTIALLGSGMLAGIGFLRRKMMM